MNAKRILAFLLASLMLIPAMAACSDDTGAPAETTLAEETTAAETEPRETERHEIKDDLPADLKFSGKTFTIYSGTQAVHDDFVMGKEEKEGDVVNDAVWERNTNVQEQLDIKLDSHPYATTYSTIAGAVSTLILAGDSTYDIYLGAQYGMTSLVSQKMFMNAYDLKYINFDQPWWMNGFMDEVTLGKDSRYILLSDFNTQAISYIRANFFNKTLYEKIYGDPNELYQMTLDGKFTFDHMNKLVAGAYADLNGNGQTDLDDQLGLLTYALAAAVDPFVYSSIKFTSRDKDGFVQLNMKTEEAVALTEKLCAFFHQPAVSSKADGKQIAIFAKGSVLFLGNGTLSNAGSSEMRDMENDFGVLPHPKGSEEQESYYSLVHDTAMVTAVPVTVKDTEKVGAVLEALSAESYRRVTPAWYEKALKLKYSRDDISVQMIDMIKDTMATDFIFAYNTSLNGIGQIYRTLVNGNNTNYMSVLDSKLPAAEAMLADLVKAFKGE